MRGKLSDVERPRISRISDGFAEARTDRCERVIDCMLSSPVTGTLSSKLSGIIRRYAQLYSRIGFVHEYRPLGPEEVRGLLGRWRPPEVSLPEDLLSDAEGVAAVIRATGGNFRLLDRLLAQVGRILKINGLEAVTREVVEAAREVLVIGAA
jgi:hypothetical protein